jgi:hypothetical protein
MQITVQTSTGYPDIFMPAVKCKADKDCYDKVGKEYEFLKTCRRQVASMQE